MPDLRARLTALIEEWDARATEDARHGIAIRSHAIRRCMSDLAALLREAAVAPPLKPSRLVHLAQHGARLSHAWYFDAAENIDEDPPAGHEQPFDTCPHPDCRLVRDAARATAPEDQP